MHNDQLSMELWIAGKSVVLDPGSYLYTPSVKERNRYRSVHAHFSPWPRDLEPAKFGPGLFSIPVPIKAQVVYFGRKGFTGEILHQCGAKRQVALLEGSVVVIDSSDEPFNKQRMLQLAYSPGYGNRLTLKGK
jgi:hypothetical protein